MTDDTIEAGGGQQQTNQRERADDVEREPPAAHGFCHQRGHGLNAGDEFSLRTSTAPLADEVRRILEAPPGSLPVSRITTPAEHVDATLVPERLITALSGLFGVVGSLLTATGLYGLLAYTLARRTREIGVRMAVGATARWVMALVLKQALGLVSVGLVIGLPIAFWTKQIAGAMVENLSADSLFPIVTAVIGTIAVSLLAAWVPARRATRVDPLTALRVE